jgi:hypothetical protein
VSRPTAIPGNGFVTTATSIWNRSGATAAGRSSVLKLDARPFAGLTENTPWYLTAFAA